MPDWKELTKEQVDELEGEQLSYCVARAMKMMCWEEHGKIWLSTDNPNINERWHPHEDANQAREVWKELGELFILHLDSEDAVVRKYGAMSGPSWYAGGDFCTTICRAFLKVKLES